MGSVLLTNKASFTLIFSCLLLISILFIPPQTVVARKLADGGNGNSGGNGQSKTRVRRSRSPTAQSAAGQSPPGAGSTVSERCYRGSRNHNRACSSSP
ncbi:hypothetical protein Patl1_16548 [Pistacia atlantica]|uniref:Uncharacterized protein n=1 Tax=Pistacia atlantica TaxID=434234 RepID=A0ACC1B6I3_9ROSI|nr:hypothetical protein Patl1_16548 [Pistacia atlantica]